MSNVELIGSTEQEISAEKSIGSKVSNNTSGLDVDEMTAPLSSVNFWLESGTILVKSLVSESTVKVKVKST